MNPRSASAEKKKESRPAHTPSSPAMGLSPSTSRRVFRIRRREGKEEKGCRPACCCPPVNSPRLGKKKKEGGEASIIHTARGAPVRMGEEFGKRKEKGGKGGGGGEGGGAMAAAWPSLHASTSISGGGKKGREGEGRVPVASVIKKRGKADAEPLDSKLLCALLPSYFFYLRGKGGKKKTRRCPIPYRSPLFLIICEG